MDRNSLRQQGISSPFPVSPKGKPGRVGSPHAGSTLRANKKRLARIDAAGSPHKRAAAPLCIPCERGGADLVAKKTWKSRHRVLT